VTDSEAKALQRALKGRYEVLEVLGRGAMGAVFRGRDPGLNRDVAIKTIQVGHDALRLERFKREAELTAALEHPGIVKVHSAGVAGGVPYLVTELVPGGKTLADVMPTLSLRQRVALIRDVASALGYAHAQGVVHRDVKPSNVLVDDKGKVRVADFGLAAGEGLEKLTRTGAAVGTPAYMPPEQIRGSRAETGPASDVWGLGIVLYEAVSGHVPFMASAYLPLSRKICEDPLPPLSGEGLDDNLEAVVVRALAKKPDERYATATELAEDLEAWLGGMTTSASSQRPARRPPDVRRLGWVVPPTAAVLLLLVVLLSSGRTPDPAETPTPGPAVTAGANDAPDPEWLRGGERRWRRIARLDEPQERLPKIESWLERYAEHPLAADARQLLRQDRRRVPSRVLRHSDEGQVRARYWGNVIVSWGEDGWVCRWDDGELTKRWRLGASIYALVITPSGLAVAAGETHELLVFPLDPNSKQAPRRAPWTDEGVAGLALALHPDGTSVAVGGNGPRVSRYAVSTGGLGAKLADYDGHIDAVHALGYSPDGRNLVTCCGYQTDQAGRSPSEMRVYDEWGGEPLVSRDMMWVGQDLAFLPGGERFVIGDSAGQLEVCDLELRPSRRFSGTEVSAFVGGGMGAESFAHSGGIRGLTLTHGASRLYSASGTLDKVDRNELRGWDVQSGEELLSVRLRPLPYVSLDASPDGRTLIAGTTQGGIEVWELE
jgi:hypothetical protein